LFSISEPFAERLEFPLETRCGARYLNGAIHCSIAFAVTTFEEDFRLSYRDELKISRHRARRARGSHRTQQTEFKQTLPSEAGFRISGSGWYCSGRARTGSPISFQRGEAGFQDFYRTALSLLFRDQTPTLQNANVARDGVQTLQANSDPDLLERRRQPIARKQRPQDLQLPPGVCIFLHCFLNLEPIQLEDNADTRRQQV
jgi:hypothetical protein